MVSDARMNDFKMIDRRNFGELLKEWELSVNGSVDDDNLVHAGRLLGADVLCVGKYTKLGKKIILRTTMVGAEKGDILAEGSTEIPLDGDLRELERESRSRPRRASRSRRRRPSRPRKNPSKSS